MKDNELIEMALLGYQIQRDRIEASIVEIREQLKGTDPGETTPAAQPFNPRSRKGTMSAEGKKRVGKAQRARWAAFRRLHRKA